MLDQRKINDLYIDYYKQITCKLSHHNLTQRKYTGYSLSKKVKPGESVLDVGCGYNLFKKLIPNLVGIDPMCDFADHRVSLQDFETDQKFDVAFCLGSIMYGSQEDVEQQIAKLCSLLKPNARIYWRTSCVGHELFFTWTIEHHASLSKKFGFELAECCKEDIKDSTELKTKKIYAEWIRTQQ